MDGDDLWESSVNRETAIRQAQDFAGSIHDDDGRPDWMMITGTVGQREVFLDQIKQLSIIKDLHVARSPPSSRPSARMPSPPASSMPSSSR